MKQKTLKTEVEFEGVGLHTGTYTRMKMRPAEVNHGVIFYRTDLEGMPSVKASLENVHSTNRSTCLKEGAAEVSTVEHALSALSSQGIDNVKIELDGPELPILDGSASIYLKSILAAGISELSEDRDYHVIREPVVYRDEETGSEIMALPADDFQLTCMIDFNSSYLGPQYAELSDLENYEDDIAACRTFVFLRELEALLEQNLIKGGDLDNAIVIVDREISQDELDNLAKKLGKPSMQVEEEGVLNNLKLHFKNEPARHKLLDLVGDLSLIGTPIKAKIIARKPGHGVNVAFGKQLASKLVSSKYNRPLYLENPGLVNLDEVPIYDANRIRDTLPHRFPFLLLDKVMYIDEKYIVGVKNVTFNEHFFMGHFPGNPVMPGVLQIEAMAQTGGIFALHTKEEPHLWDTYFAKISEAKFKRMVVPGDTLIFVLELMAPIKRGMCYMSGKAYVGNELASEAQLVAKIIKRSDG